MVGVGKLISVYALKILTLLALLSLTYCVTYFSAEAPGGVTKGELTEHIFEAYSLIYELEHYEVNTSRLVTELREAIALIEVNLTKSNSIAKSVINEAKKILMNIDQILFWRYFWLAFYLGITVALALTAFMLSRKYLPLLWLKLRSKSIITYRGEGRKRTLLFDPEVSAVILAIIVVVSVFAIAQIIRPKVVEPFSAIGLLGEKGKIGDYPETVIVGDEIKLHIFVDNHMGYSTLYKILVKIDNSTKESPLQQPPIDKLYVLLENGKNVTIPYVYEVTENGRYRLVFELWYYNVKTNNFTYYAWVHLWLNATLPPL